MKAPHLF